MGIVLVSIGGYFINGYWWLFHCKPLRVILLMVIDGYRWLFYWWLLMVIGSYYIINYYWLYMLYYDY